MVLKGFRFGMLLQFAVGPICFFVFRCAAVSGFMAAGQVVLAVTAADALLITLAGTGAAGFLRRSGIAAAVRWIGCLVLVICGCDMILSAFQIALLPRVTLFAADGGSLFWQGVLLTISNPLTIVFWSGMFTAQMMGNQWKRPQLCSFAAGCVLATLVFLSAVAVLGCLCSRFLPQSVIRVLNAAVGIVLAGYGWKLLRQKAESAA